MKLSPPLDPGFTPPIKIINQIEERSTTSLFICLERQGSQCVHHEVRIDEQQQKESLFISERVIKFLLWAHGGWKLYLDGPENICKELRDIYSQEGKRKFDVKLMQRVYGKEFQVEIKSRDQFPVAAEAQKKIGGNFSGYRIGFDLGASDYKISAVVDGNSIFSTEIPWDPVTQKDPEYHYKKIKEGFDLALKYLKKLDAIGGSSAGIIVDNQVKIASLFRSVPEDLFQKKVGSIFLRLKEEYNVPFEVINDGDVTALAGALSLKENGILGIAMGSSEAAGYVDPTGFVTGRLNELAFAPVDFNESAMSDEWSKDSGVGALYFSQQGVNRLALQNGHQFDPNLPLPERLKEIQVLAEQGDDLALKLFETLGICFGYTIPWYARFYEIKNLLILGRVTSGIGGEIILQKAKEVLDLEFSHLKITLSLPDEKNRRVGQSVAAASLPLL